MITVGYIIMALYVFLMFCLGVAFIVKGVLRHKSGKRYYS